MFDARGHWFNNTETTAQLTLCVCVCVCACVCVCVCVCVCACVCVCFLRIQVITVRHNGSHQNKLLYQVPWVTHPVSQSVWVTPPQKPAVCLTIADAFFPLPPLSSFSSFFLHKSKKAEVNPLSSGRIIIKKQSGSGERPRQPLQC